MSTKTLVAAAFIASLTAIAGQAWATDNPNAETQATAQQPGTVTRAEVLADLQIYRESGLAQADLPENTGMDNDRKAKAQARYAQLRSSPYYATLVKRYRDGEHQVEVAAVR